MGQQAGVHLGGGPGGAAGQGAGEAAAERIDGGRAHGRLGVRKQLHDVVQQQGPHIVHAALVVQHYVHHPPQCKQPARHREQRKGVSMVF